ncbi:MAG: hypothetical protein CFH16_00546 [Alphaproteobacteria bacterium MarineAlpha5_Bin6]|nr:MAG: hypothetical protein CFH17_00632 [Alphaproteobacteria bacterium MarineAlpha5_Bin7]PPR54229.1 MAG: hypothetical protein CFH16_00546 [Alphaproteobacteria bacterium MarineAlpha5_Bin6]|tara:strand:- start:398 stop:979 length:582 start_codon:yes stop_codon:yes gene_type:complete
MNLLNISKKYILIISFFLISCQPVEIMQEVVFDNTVLNKFNVVAEQKTINNLYELKYDEKYIDGSLTNPPLLRLNNWLNENFIIFGNENKFVINILDASITKIERENSNKKKYEGKNEFFYELSFVVEYVLYSDNKIILATTKVQTNRTTTSSVYISLNEKELIIDNMILDALKDLSIKSNELIKRHMSKFIL